MVPPSILHFSSRQLISSNLPASARGQSGFRHNESYVVICSSFRSTFLPCSRLLNVYRVYVSRAVCQYTSVSRNREQKSIPALHYNNENIIKQLSLIPTITVRYSVCNYVSRKFSRCSTFIFALF